MVFQAIAELIAERTECDVNSITMDSKFQDLGIDSLDTVDLLMQLEDKLGMTIELEESVETVGDLVKIIEDKQKEQKEGGAEKTEGAKEEQKVEEKTEEKMAE